MLTVDPEIYIYSLKLEYKSQVLLEEKQLTAIGQNASPGAAWGESTQ